MKTHLYIIFLSLFCSTSIVAQERTEPKPNREEMLEKIRTQKIAFITSKVELTSEEAKMFWPIYNEYEAELKKINELKRQNIKKAKGVDNLSDSDAKNITANYFKYQQQELDVKIKYNSKFSQILSDKKVMKLYIAERRFKERLYEEIQNRRKQDRGSGQSPRRGNMR